mmetsp:Transcript_70242/g.139127  ORF Transcript_70242/g.139127 Transcript_70242/m.139127 type:complete len:155 (-) Transcript_70242:193-657(-)
MQSTPPLAQSDSCGKILQTITKRARTSSRPRSPNGAELLEAPGLTHGGERREITASKTDPDPATSSTQRCHGRLNTSALLSIIASQKRTNNRMDKTQFEGADRAFRLRGGLGNVYSVYEQAKARESAMVDKWAVYGSQRDTVVTDKVKNSPPDK